MKRILLIGMIASCAINAKAQKDFKVLKTFKISGAGGWDYIAVQPNSNRVFVSHGTQVNIIDKNTGDSLGVIPNTIGVHGIAFVPALNKGYTTNGKTNTSTVFNLKTFAIIDSIPTGQKPDAIFYDAAIKKIVVCNGKSKDLSFIDPSTDKVVATVGVGGSPETAVSDGAGKIFVNIEDKNEIVAIDGKTYSILAHWPITPGDAPTGLVIDTKTKRLFAACGDNSMLIAVNVETGAIIDKLAIGAGCDGAAFDPTTNNIYTSNGTDGTITVIHEDDANKFAVTGTSNTKKGSRTIALDTQTHLLYLPTADLEASTGKGRPKAIPGTFQVLVVGKR
ncbi:YncE family protein [Parasediminibacterium sp. JCM 36343]|uniref:YVTN family beta-propeller repeat protein n=1 Tax=Parasediminibacterium sp. JCM 36343 TaxID=3374279 RepID=UPI00397E137B